MKVFTFKEELLGKTIYKDPRLQKLKERFNPPKITYYTVEFTNQNRESCDCFLMDEEELLDLIVEDIGRAEALLSKVDNKEIIQKVLNLLEESKPLFSSLREEEKQFLKNYNFITLKPVVYLKDNMDTLSLLEKIFKATSSIFFFTVNRKEARAWLIPQGWDILQSAGKIHSDLARGFIRGEVYNIKDLDKFKNPQDAQAKGLLKIVDKNYVVRDGDVINIKFKV